MVGLQPEPADPHGVRRADGEVVPGDGHVGRGGAEHLVRHGEFEVKHPVGDGQRDRGHVRNCTWCGVPDTHGGTPALVRPVQIEANVDTFAHFTDRARAAGTVVVPAMAFYGGLGDLLATAAMGDWTAADEAHIAYGLSGWHPTAGTRAAGKVSGARRGGRHVRYTNGRLEHHDDDLPTLEWPFPDPMGTRAVIGEFTMADVVTVPSHLSIPEVRTYMTTEAARDLSAPDTPPPAAVDERGRSAQTFLVDVVVRSGGTERRAVARGQDIYAVSAPLAVEAVHRILTGRTRTVGVASAGEIFDAPDFLRTLSTHISFELSQQ